MVRDFLAKHPKVMHLETSAKKKEGVDAAFEKIAEASIANREDEM